MTQPKTIEEKIGEIMANFVSDLDDVKDEWDKWNYDGHEEEFGISLKEMVDEVEEKATKAIMEIMEEERVKAKPVKECVTRLYSKQPNFINWHNFDRNGVCLKCGLMVDHNILKVATQLNPKPL